MVRKHGPKRAKLLQRRLIQLRAAPSLAALAPPYSGPARCHELTGNRAGQLSVDLDHPYRLIFESIDAPPARDDAGGLDWSKVRKINIIEIADTHG